jgi:hypothetical protein
MLGFGLVFEVAVLGMARFCMGLLLLHVGVTYKNEDKDMAEVMKYLYGVARLLS